MARSATAKKTTDAPAKAPKNPGAIIVTYCPREQGDPHETKWNGHVFKANVPREVSDPLMKKQIEGNHYFEVEGDTKRNLEKRRRKNATTKPDADEYDVDTGMVGADAIVKNYTEVEAAELDPVDE